MLRRATRHGYAYAWASDAATPRRRFVNAASIYSRDYVQGLPSLPHLLSVSFQLYLFLNCLRSIIQCSKNLVILFDELAFSRDPFTFSRSPVAYVTQSRCSNGERILKIGPVVI